MSRYAEDTSLCYQIFAYHEDLRRRSKKLYQLESKIELTIGLIRKFSCYIDDATLEELAVLSRVIEFKTRLEKQLRKLKDIRQKPLEEAVEVIDVEENEDDVEEEDDVQLHLPTTKDRFALKRATESSELIESKENTEDYEQSCGEAESANNIQRADHNDKTRKYDTIQEDNCKEVNDPCLGEQINWSQFSMHIDEQTIYGQQQKNEYNAFEYDYNNYSVGGDYQLCYGFDEYSSYAEVFTAEMRYYEQQQQRALSEQQVDPDLHTVCKDETH